MAGYTSGVLGLILSTGAFPSLSHTTTFMVYGLVLPTHCGFFVRSTGHQECIDGMRPGTECGRLLWLVQADDVSALQSSSSFLQRSSPKPSAVGTAFGAPLPVPAHMSVEITYHISGCPHQASCLAQQHAQDATGLHKISVTICRFGAKTVWIIRVCMVVLAPVAWPLAFILNKVPIPPVAA